MSILETKDLTYIYSKNTPYRKDAIKDVTISLNEGEIVGIIGQTGSGKSTLVRCLNGLLKPEKGEMYFNGEKIHNDSLLKKLRFNVGLVFQYPEYQLFAENIHDDIAFGPKNMGITGERLEELIVKSAREAGLEERLLQSSPFELSGGEKRRAAIAGVIAMQPKILILDEPTAGLDPEGRNNVFNMIQSYRKTTGSTVVIVSHSMEDVARYTERVVIMKNGSVFAQGATHEIFSNAQTLVDAGLDIPQTTKVFLKLREMGHDVPADIYSPDVAVEYFQKRFASGVKR